MSRFARNISHRTHNYTSQFKSDLLFSLSPLPNIFAIRISEMSSDEQVPVGDARDNDYASRTGQSHIPVQRDEAPIGDPYNSTNADSDQQLGT